MNKSSRIAALGRFAGDHGRALALEALRDSRALMGCREAAEEILDAGRMVAFEPGDRITVEGDWSNTLIFMLAGSVRCSVRGVVVAVRQAPFLIGELEFVDPTQPQSATMTATEKVIALVLTEPDFAKIVARFPYLWRQISKSLGEMVRNRNLTLRPSNAVPQIFVASATESLAVAEALSAGLGEGGVEVHLWTGGMFKPAEHALESLSHRLVAADFAVAVFSPDDKVESRGVAAVAPRDNTVFELGLFAGAIGRERSFYAVPKGGSVKIPSDLAGITSVRYEVTNGAIDCRESCARILERIGALGPR